ncbi:MAG: hypothetical protein V1753_02610 [Pseudomonadota bacterium]
MKCPYCGNEEITFLRNTPCLKFIPGLAYYDCTQCGGSHSRIVVKPVHYVIVGLVSFLITLGLSWLMWPTAKLHDDTKKEVIEEATAPKEPISAPAIEPPITNTPEEQKIPQNDAAKNDAAKEVTAEATAQEETISPPVIEPLVNTPVEQIPQEDNAKKEAIAEAITPKEIISPPAIQLPESMSAEQKIPIDIPTSMETIPEKNIQEVSPKLSETAPTPLPAQQPVMPAITPPLVSDNTSKPPLPKIKVLSGDGKLASANKLAAQIKNIGFKVESIDMAPRSNFGKVTLYYNKDVFKKTAQEMGGKIGRPFSVKKLSWASQFDIIIVTGETK